MQTIVTATCSCCCCRPASPARCESDYGMLVCGLERRRSIAKCLDADQRAAPNPERQRKERSGLMDRQGAACQKVSPPLNTASEQHPPPPEIGRCCCATQHSLTCSPFSVFVHTTTTRPTLHTLPIAAFLDSSLHTTPRKKRDGEPKPNSTTPLRICDHARSNPSDLAHG